MTDLAGLDALIERRAEQNAAEGEREALWKESVRTHHEKRRRKYAAEWYGYHLDQAERLERTAAALAEEHRARAAALLEERS